MNLDSTTATYYLHVSSIVLSIYEVLCININISVTKRIGEGFWGVLLEDYGRAFSGFSLSRLFEWYCLFRITIFALRYINKKSFNFRERFCIASPSILFAASMIIGKSFQMGHSLEAVWGSKLQILKSLTAFSGYLIFFICLTICVFYFFNYLITYIHSNCTDWKERYPLISMVYKRPFVFTFIFLLIIWMPYVIIYYPGIFTNDAQWQVDQLIRICTLEPSELVWGKTIRLENHHPIAHTLLLDSFVILGKYFTDSYNIGLFLYTLFVMLSVIASISFFVKSLVEKLDLHPSVIFICLFYFLIHPFMQQIIAVCTKDSIYAVAFFLFIMFSFLRFKFKDDKKYTLAWLICAVGLVVFRKEGAFVAIPSMIFQSLFYDNRKREYKYILGMVAIALGLNFVLLPAFHIKQSGIEDALSIPIQQTARYIKWAGNDVTPEEKEILSQLFDYDKIPEKYIGHGTVDSVKYLKKKDLLSDINQYLFVWREMFKKHPAIFLEAFLDFKYQFIYPDAIFWWEFTNHHSKKSMNWINRRAGTDFSHFDSMDSLRDYYEMLRRDYFRNPIIGIINNTSIYVWICLLCVSYCISRNSWASLIIWLPFILHLIMIIMGPTNGNFPRYMYVYIIAFVPAIICMMDIIYDEQKVIVGLCSQREREKL